QAMIAAVEEAIGEAGGTRELTVTGDGSSGGMEKEMIHEMFCRSLAKYDVKYISYVGDGDAKVNKYLIGNPTYSTIDVNKLEDTNHFTKRMLTRIMKIKRENINKILCDGKRLSGKGRLTVGQAIKFKIYFAKAIRENKTDINKLYRASWAIFNHHYSTNEEPMHDWCDAKWCKYLQAKSVDQNFVNSKTSIRGGYQANRCHYFTKSLISCLAVHLKSILAPYF
ncbi:unnamed protein product, partial [Didymodactylos carnosus]